MISSLASAVFTPPQLVQRWWHSTIASGTDSQARGSWNVAPTADTFPHWCAGLGQTAAVSAVLAWQASRDHARTEELEALRRRDLRYRDEHRQLLALSATRSWYAFLFDLGVLAGAWAGGSLIGHAIGGACVRGHLLTH
jgi:hypothetical protein